VRRLALLLLIAACVQPNAVTLRELEDRSRAAPRPDLEAVVDHAGPVPIVGRGYPTTLPMVECRVPAAKGRINDVEMPFILDTGASHVALSGPAARAAALYVPERDPVQMVSPGYAMSHRICVFESLKLGPTLLAPGTATVSMGETAGRSWAGLDTPAYAIVGGTVLSHFRITFDFARRQVRLVPHGRPASALALWIPVAINGRRYHMLVDSGATRPILEPWAAVELGLLSEDQARRHQVKAPEESESRYSRFTLDSLTVAGRTFRHVSAAAVRTFGDQPIDGKKAGGLLGLVGFGRLVWTIDYGTRELEIEDGP
jgi:predicted aspartyl protease